ncbi:hypothetical protein [Moorena sp. SIO3H5]|uniref:hypothetical protein n=1 Tax=Moorena sp. SIO3H5 TaxID=2607834 RepID=UPI0013B60E10|nr:hypothetical protein [Moorena sp. SIO3H5]NEO74670.1 hypothetical protein [Moorena sp. SIO3H5]
MSANKYLILLGNTNGIRPIMGDEVDFIRNYIRSDVFKYSYHEFSYRNQVLIENPINGLEITGICRDSGKLIRGNAVIAVITGSNVPTISGMDLKIAEIAREEILIVSKMVHNYG